MDASSSRQKWKASLAELEKLAGEKRASSRLAAATSAQLSGDLERTLASAKSRHAPSAAVVEDAAQLTDFWTTNHSAPPYPSWAVPAAPAIAILGLLVIGAGYLASGNVRAVREADQPSHEFILPPDTTAQAPAARETAAAEPSAPAAAEQIASAPAPGNHLPEPPPVTPPLTAKTVAAVELTAAATSLPSGAPVAKPEKKLKRHAADRSDEKFDKAPGSKHHAKTRPASVASKPRETSGAAVSQDNVDAEPIVISDARRVAKKISGVFSGWGSVDPLASR